MELITPILRALVQWISAYLVTAGLFNSELAGQFIGVAMAIAMAIAGFKSQVNANSEIPAWFWFTDQRWENILRQATHFIAGVLVFKGVLPSEYLAQAVPFVISFVTFVRSYYVKFA